MHTSHFIRTTDIHTAYHEVGNDFPFVLVHGYTGSKLDFHDQLIEFAPNRRVIAFDQRGHGESTNQAPYTFDQLIEDLRSFLDQMSIEQCDLLGHSMGGMIALRGALAFPERIRSLILMDTSADPMADIGGDAMPTVIDKVLQQGCESLLPLMQLAPPSIAVQRGIDTLGEAEHWRRIGVKLAQMDPLAFVALRDEMMQATSVGAQLKSIACPTTILVGAEDKPFIQPSKLMASQIPRAQLATIPHSAHSPQYENESDWRDAVAGHLKRVEIPFNNH